LKPAAQPKRRGLAAAAKQSMASPPAATDPERHPTIDNVNALLAERLSTTEHICRRIAAMTGAPAALVAAIILQFVWIGIGLATNWDPYPFVFLLTCSNTKGHSD